LLDGAPDFLPLKPATRAIQTKKETNLMQCTVKKGTGKNRFIMTTIFAVGLVLTFQPATAQVKKITFNLTPQAKFLNCLGVEGGPTPTATVTVTRGNLHDTLTLKAANIKPKLGFDLFTIQNTNLLSDGQPDPNFQNFGLAWYQTDVEANKNGEAQVTINTILLDQIFGFDPASNLLPTHTFHVGFWFNNPNDAVACGFDATKPTPFNGEQDAGPNAMISLPDETTDLGPLCTNPVLQDGTYVCKE
jgi:hypothetical protein